MNVSKLREIVEDRGAWRAAVHGVAKTRTQPSNWTTTAIYMVNLGWWGCYLFQLIGEQKESERSKVCLDSKPRSYTLCFSLHYNRITYALLAHSIAWSCLTLCDPLDCSPPGSSVQGILQARILEWVAISSSRGSSWPRDRTWVSCTADTFFTDWVTRDVCKDWYSMTFYCFLEVYQRSNRKTTYFLIE